MVIPGTAGNNSCKRFRPGIGNNRLGTRTDYRSRRCRDPGFLDGFPGKSCVKRTGKYRPEEPVFFFKRFKKENIPYTSFCEDGDLMKLGSRSLLRISSTGAGRFHQSSKARAPWCRSIVRPFAVFSQPLGK